jgi:serine/threonine protein kinase
VKELNDESRVREIISNTLRLRESGDQLSDEDILATHPDLADQLGEQLKQLRLIENARKLAELDSVEETISVGRDGSTKSSHPQAMEDEPRAGQQIRHYVLEEQIGLGGFGTVWRARDSKLECDVAVKIPRQGAYSPEDIDRFIREARLAAQLRKHPNIVSVHEADWDAATAFIVSDFVVGDSLDDRLNQSRIPFEEAVDLLVTICSAVHHAHEAGIIHRDLKPDNILLDESGAPHITDFGLAKQKNQTVATDSGGIMGTAAYMSPEQARGDSDRADKRPGSSPSCRRTCMPCGASRELDARSSIRAARASG